jgi:hypothetical protein
VGEWVNVISYVTAVSSATQCSDKSSNVQVQAIVLWSAGSFDLHNYERSLDRQKYDENRHNNSTYAKGQII